MQHGVGGVALAPPVVAVAPLVLQAAVVQEPQRHRVVHRRLMLDQQVHGLRATAGVTSAALTFLPAGVVRDHLGLSSCSGRRQKSNHIFELRGRLTHPPFGSLNLEAPRQYVRYSKCESLIFDQRKSPDLTERYFTSGKQQRSRKACRNR